MHSTGFSGWFDDEGGVQVLSNIALHVNLQALTTFIGPVKGAARRALVPELAAEAEFLAQPRVAYKSSIVKHIHRDVIGVDEVEFRSELLGRILKEGQRVYPFVLTIGPALENRAASTERLWNHLVLDAMGTLLVTSLSRHLELELKKQFGTAMFSRFSPGSLEAWPLSEQRPLFTLLGDVEALIGVKLNEKLFMIPKKSLSGMYAATREMHLSCRLCSKTPCPGRMAPFSARLRRAYGLPLIDETPAPVKT